jgi:hypothetical protein
VALEVPLEVEGGAGLGCLQHGPHRAVRDDHPRAQRGQQSGRAVGADCTAGWDMPGAYRAAPVRRPARRPWAAGRLRPTFVQRAGKEGAMSTPPAVVSSPPPLGGLDVDLPGADVRLRATRWPGSGTPVLLLHGLARPAGSGTSWCPGWPVCRSSPGPARPRGQRPPGRALRRADGGRRRADRAGRRRRVPCRRRRSLVGRLDRAAAGRGRPVAGAGRGRRGRRHAARSLPWRHRGVAARPDDAAADRAAARRAAGGAAQRTAGAVVEPGRRGGGAADLRASGTTAWCALGCRSRRTWPSWTT